MNDSFAKRVYIGSFEKNLRFYCGWETAIGLALSAAGTGAQMSASSSEADAMNKAAADELARQQEYQKRGQQILDTNITANTPQTAKGQISSGQQKAEGEYAKANAIPLTSSTGNTAVSRAMSPNNIVGQDTAGRIALQNQAAAPLQGYNDWQVQQWIKDLQTKTALNQNMGFSRASANVLPLEEQAAQRSEATTSGIGSLLNTAGGLLSLYGATRPVTNPTTSLSQLSNYPGTASILNSAANAQRLGNWATSPTLSTFNLY